LLINNHMNNISLQKIQLMDASQLRRYRRIIDKLLSQKTPVLKGELLSLVEQFLARKASFLALARKHTTPFYILDKPALEMGLKAFTAAFDQHLPGCEYYYAMKVNHHPYIIKRAVAHGFGIDISSGRELMIALRCGAKKLVFSGPGKTLAELELAVSHSDKVIINLDSFQELARLNQVASKKRRSVRAGVRIFTRYHNVWNKFGIDLTELPEFWRKSQEYPSISLQGIQFHMSWNENARPYALVIKELAGCLVQKFTKAELATIKFIDFGGGFRPYLSEGYYPWGTLAGSLIKTVDDHLGQMSHFKDKYYITAAVPIDRYAYGIGQAIKKYLQPLVNCVYYTEPGRIIANGAMHVMLQVVDVKSPQKIIADGGINIVGWERFLHDYFPLINLTNPDRREVSSCIYGSLCMPDDLWGYTCFAKKIKLGDYILVPNQGGLTFSLAQNFIKPIPPVYFLNK